MRPSADIRGASAAALARRLTLVRSDRIRSRTCCREARRRCSPRGISPEAGRLRRVAPIRRARDSSRPARRSRRRRRREPRWFRAPHQTRSARLETPPPQDPGSADIWSEISAPCGAGDGREKQERPRDRTGGRLIALHDRRPRENGPSPPSREARSAARFGLSLEGEWNTIVLASPPRLGGCPSKPARRAVAECGRDARVICGGAIRGQWLRDRRAATSKPSAAPRPLAPRRQLRQVVRSADEAPLEPDLAQAAQQE